MNRVQRQNITNQSFEASFCRVESRGEIASSPSVFRYYGSKAKKKMPQRVEPALKLSYSHPMACKNTAKTPLAHQIF